MSPWHFAGLVGCAVVTANALSLLWMVATDAAHNDFLRQMGVYRATALFAVTAVAFCLAASAFAVWDMTTGGSVGTAFGVGGLFGQYGPKAVRWCWARRPGRR